MPPSAAPPFAGQVIKYRSPDRWVELDEATFWQNSTWPYGLHLHRQPERSCDAFDFTLGFNMRSIRRMPDAESPSPFDSGRWCHAVLEGMPASGGGGDDYLTRFCSVAEASDPAFVCPYRCSGDRANGHRRCYNQTIADRCEKAYLWNGPNESVFETDEPRGNETPHGSYRRCTYQYDPPGTWSGSSNVISRVVHGLNVTTRYAVACSADPTQLVPDPTSETDPDSQGRHDKVYYAEESVGIASGMLITAIHLAGLVPLTHTPSPLAFLSQVLDRPAHERPYLLLPVGYPANSCSVPAIHRKPLSEILVVEDGVTR